MKLKILWNSKDHPDLNSGYGIISRNLLPYLGDKYGRENIFIFAPIYQKDCTGEWDGMKVLPGVTFDYGENIILDHYKNNGCNILLQVGDAWPLGIVPDLAAADQIDWVQWLPVDWLGMPKNIINRILPAHKLVPFSKYGENALRKYGLSNVEPAIWIGLDTEMWRPQPREELPDMMNLLGFESDSFNLLIVAANQERKNIREQLEAIRLLLQLNPDIPIRIYLHTQMKRDRDLYADIDELGLQPYVVYPQQFVIETGGIKEEEMVMMFNCADVLLNACLEGFGIPMTQAQACGVPVIYLLEGPGSELVQFGVGVPPMANITFPNQMTKPIPHPAAIADALGTLWEKRVQNGRPLRSPNAIDFVQRNLGWKNIAEQWFEVIERVMEEKERFCYDIPEPADWLRERAKEEVVLK